MARTLFAILQARLGPAEELKVFNPLQARLGAAIQIDRLDYRGKDFTMKVISEYKRCLGTTLEPFVDYTLNHASNDLAGNQWPWDIRLRLNPTEGKLGGVPYQVLLLSLYYQCGFQEAKESGLADAVVANTGEFAIDWQGKRVYYRINDLRKPYQCTVKTLEDTDGNGVVDADEVMEKRLDYFDYHTELLDEAQQKYLEYLFVEYEPDNGWWQIWQGVEIPPEQITVL